jgi:formylglycine-generating enzyme required for sulfatase activity
MDFVLIPEGIFAMGCGEGDSCMYDEKPQVHVAISKPFYLGKYEVTQEQWEVVMASRPSVFRGEQRPVENVSWNEVREFIRRLNAREGTNRYRLPTEAEWEYAARAGTSTKYSSETPALNEFAWHLKNANRQTHPVGEKRGNQWGLHDMHGNVWEWVQDWYLPGTYAKAGDKSTVIDPQGPAEAATRVLRGGSWSNEARYLRSAHRNAYPPDYKSANVGFRVAMSLKEPSASERLPHEAAAGEELRRPTESSKLETPRIEIPNINNINAPEVKISF